MAEGVAAPEPEDADDVAEVQPAGSRLAAQRPEHAPLPRTALCRHPPKVGAQCGNPARWDLCGGRGAILVPTAIVEHTWEGQALVVKPPNHVTHKNAA
jgi:hypothetical protein